MATELEGFVDGSLAAAAASAIASHLSTCNRCQTSIEVLRSEHSLLGSLGRILEQDAIERTPALTAGMTVAGFRLVREIGQGGMGSVWEAEQDKPRRRVAFKVARPGRLSAHSLRRLEHEAEVLAQLQHRGIAQVFAAGSFDTPHGRQPWFAMELVAGAALLEHAAGLELDGKVRLLIDICDGVQHVHQKGVIHRDLKPDNVRVEAGGQPKVLDFGVARADLESGADLRETQAGHLVGTVAYMSPEQASGVPQTIDTRTDVWALGAIALEVLTGELPHDLRGLTPAQALRRIADAAPRRIDQIEPQLPGDLVAIVSKALTREKDERYASAAELASDLGRFLRHETVTARPLSAVYQLRKLARRHRTLALALVAVAISLVAGLALALSQARRARAGEQEARRQLQIAKGTKDFLQEVLILASPSEHDGAPPTIHRALDIALERVDRHLIEQPVVEGAVRHVLGEILLAMGKHADAERHLSQGLALYEAEYGDQHKQVLYVLAHLGRCQVELGRFADAEQTLERALAMRQVIEPRNAFILAAALDAMASANYARGELAAAERHLRQELATLQLIEEEYQRRLNIAVVSSTLAMVLEGQGRRQEAATLYAAAVAERRALSREGDPGFAVLLSNYAGMLHDTGDLAAAEALLREALTLSAERLGRDSEDAALTRGALGSVLFDSGQRDEGLRLVAETVATLRERLGTHPRVVQMLNRLTGLQATAGNDTGAEAAAREALQIGEQNPGAKHFLTNEARWRLGAALLRRGRATEAEPLLARAVALYDGALAWRTAHAHEARMDQGRCLLALERFDDAETHLLAAWERAVGPQRNAIAELLASVYDASGTPEAASQWRARAAR